MLGDFEHCSLPLSIFIFIKEILQNHKQSVAKQIQNPFLEKVKAGIIHRPQNARAAHSHWDPERKRRKCCVAEGPEPGNLASYRWLLDAEGSYPEVYIPVYYSRQELGWAAGDWIAWDWNAPGWNGQKPGGRRWREEAQSVKRPHYGRDSQKALEKENTLSEGGAHSVLCPVWGSGWQR